MPNIFLYTGTRFLRAGGAVAVGNGGEAQFALQNLLPNVPWATIHNVHPDTMGRPLDAGKRQFRYASGALPGGTLFSTLLDSTAETNAQGGMIAFAQERLGLTAAAGDRATNASAYIPKVQLDRLINQIIDALELTAPPFAIADCNSFHNAAYILGSVALFDCPAPVLIINVDQHKDVAARGMPGQSFTRRALVSSDRWGSYMLERVDSGAYLALGCGGPGNQHMVSQVKVPGGHVDSHVAPRVSGPQVIDHGVGNALEGHMDTVLTTLQAAIGAPFRSVYITVDRDCMKRNFTQWGEIGAVIPDHATVIAMLDTVLARVQHHSPNAALEGMDVCGLPEEGCGPVAPPAYAYADMVTEVSDYRTFFTANASTRARNGGGGLGWPIMSPSALIDCTQPGCQNQHSFFISSPFGRWHTCVSCDRIFCPTCGSNLPRPAGSYVLGFIPTTRTRACPCGGVTELID